MDDDFQNSESREVERPGPVIDSYDLCIDDEHCDYID